MVTLPTLKFDKSITYLKDQLLIQGNNKQLILDIITNIGIMKNQNTDSSNYDEILKSANYFLNEMSSNITTIEQLNLEISNISKDLQSEQNKQNKSKEFYIAFFSTLKRNIESFTFKFQNLEKKLEKDNLKFNNFINENNFKYNITANSKEDSYELTSFSVKNKAKNIIKSTKPTFKDHENESCPEGYDVFNIIPTEEQIKNQKIDELAEEFKNLLKSTSDVEALSNASTAELIKEFIDNKITDTNSDVSLRNNIDSISDDDDDLLEALLLEDESTLDSSEIDNTADSSVSDIISKDNNSEETINELDNTETNNEVNKINDASINESIKEDLVDTNEDVIEVNPLLDNPARKDNIFSYIEIENNVSFIIKKTIKSREYIKFEKNAFRYVAKSNPFYDEEDSFEKIQSQVRSSYSDFFEFSSSHSFDNEILDEYAQYHFNPAHYEYGYNDNIDEFIKPDLVNSEDLGIDSFLISQIPTAFDSLQFVNDLLGETDTNEDTDELITNTNFEENLADVEEENETIDELEIVENDETGNTDNEDETDNIDTVEENDLEDEMSDIDISNDEENADIDIDDISLDDFDNLDDTSLIDSLVEDELAKDKPLTNFPKKPISKVFDFADKDENFDEYDVLRDRIENAACDSHLLLISEKTDQIYLPYTISELEEYLKIYPDSYTSLADVVNQEFIFPYDYFSKHLTLTRFKETYILMKDRCAKELSEAISYATKVSKLGNINPAVIAACKTKNELDSYIYYLESDNLERFKFFDIMYESKDSLKLPFNFKRAYKDESTVSLDDSFDEYETESHDEDDYE